jgi:hypothetical protein
MPVRPVLASPPPARLQPIDISQVPPYSAPTLFALPSEQGFSEHFPADRINLDLSFAPPKQPQFFLEPGRIREGDPNPESLSPAIKPIRAGLRLPGIAAKTTTIPQTGLILSVSPELLQRATQLTLPVRTDKLPAYARAHIRVEPNGMVSRCFFDTTPKNTALPAAVRALRFAPAPQATEGWIEIRYTPEENN